MEEDEKIRREKGRRLRSGVTKFRAKKNSEIERKIKKKKEIECGME